MATRQDGGGKAFTVPRFLLWETNFSHPHFSQDCKILFSKTTEKLSKLFKIQKNIMLKPNTSLNVNI